MIKIYEVGKVAREDIFSRCEPEVDVETVVAEIIENVKTNKDKALFEYTEKFDKAVLSSLLVSEEEINEAVEAVEPEFLEILKKASENIRKFHSRQVRNSFVINDESGIVVGQKVIPVDRAGLYVPGGTAAYPSTVLMDSIPAKIAGVKEVVMVTPPNKEGKVNPVILAAAFVAGVDRIFKVGGSVLFAKATKLGLLPDETYGIRDSVRSSLSGTGGMSWIHPPKSPTLHSPLTAWGCHPTPQ